MARKKKTAVDKVAKEVKKVKRDYKKAKKTLNTPKEMYQKTKKELTEEYLSDFKKIQKSMNARENFSKKIKSGGWRYLRSYDYELYKELQNIKDYTQLGRQDMMKALKTVERIKKSNYTLDKTKARIRKENAKFLEKNEKTLKLLLEREGKRVTEYNILMKAKEFTDSEDYYDFLHSETYKKITEKHKMESGDLIKDYLKNPDNALKHYEDYLKEVENPENEIQFEERELLYENPFEN